MYPGASAKKFGSTSFETLRSKDGVHKIATFPTSVHGAAAQFDLLLSSYTGVTLEKAITRWCGSYYAVTYVKVLKDRSGIDADTVLTRAMLADHEIAVPLAKAMAWQEAGQDYPLKDDEWIEAHVMALGGETAAPSWNPRNDVPTPKPETRRREAVKTVAKHPLTVASGIGSAAVAVKELAANGVPAVPDVATKSLEHVGAWKRLGGGVLEIGREIVGVVAVTGKLWPYVLGAGIGSAVLGVLIWRRRNADAST